MQEAANKLYILRVKRTGRVAADEKAGQRAARSRSMKKSPQSESRQRLVIEICSGSKARENFDDDCGLFEFFSGFWFIYQ